MRKLVYYVAVTADGFIAGPDGEVDAFVADPELYSALWTEYPETCPTHLREAFGVTGPPRHFDTVLLGANTHQPALDAGLTSAYPHLRQFVVTHRTDLPSDPSLTVVADDPAATVRTLKQESGLDIWLCGGGVLAAQLIDEIDEFHVKVNPVLIGAGIPLLGRAVPPVGLTVRDRLPLPAGVELITYTR